MLTGLPTLIKLIVRRDRVKLPIWIIGIVATLLSMIPLLKDTYGDAASLTTLYQTFASNAAGLFLTGPMDAPTFGGLMTIETVLWWGLAVAFMNTLLIVRHTRQNEEMGAQELLLSGQLHRGTGLLAALIVAFFANLIIAIGIGAGLALMEHSWDVQNAWLYALSMGLFGFAWAVIAAIVAQFVESARSANGIVAGLIGMTFVIRGVGDFMGKTGTDGLVHAAWVSWLSPFGWLQATRSLTYPEWWPLLIPVAFVAIAIPVAFWLLARRDVGAGIVPARRGKARASVFLKSPLGLTWHLQKNVFIGWIVGVLAMAMTIGVLVPQMSHVYEGSESTKALIEAIGGSGAMIPAFLSAMLAMLAVMVLAYVVQALGKLSSEESSGHLENVLVTRVSRLQWLSLHIAVILMGGVVMLAVASATLAVCVNVGTDITVSVGEYIGAGLSYVPLLGLFIGLYGALFGIVPRLAGVVVWLLFGFVAFMSWLGPLLKLDRWIMDLSPLSHIAAAPAEAIAWWPLVIMLAAAAMLGLIGAALFRTRNIQTS